MYELSTNCANPKQLRQTDFAAYDAVYLGDFSCLDYPSNFSAHPELLEKAVTELKSQGKKVYLRLYATPGNEDLPQVREMIETAKTLPFDAIEVHNLGVLRILQQLGCTLPVHLGVFGNLYTDASARVLKEFGVTRVYPNPELSLTEIHYIREQTPIEIILPVHGKIPLVISETCFIIENSPATAKKVDCNGKSVCSFPCSQDYWLNRSNGQWVLKDTGRMTLSGKDLCMLEHIPELLQAGQQFFYIQSHGESPEYVETTGKLYRQALQQALNQEQQGIDNPDQHAEMAALRALSKEGLCNGYYFEGAGQTYIARG